MDDLLTVLGLAVGLAIALEGALYALFPAAMRRLIARALEQSENSLRIGGLVAAVAGVALVWAIRAF
jgi:uncharacterized protein YjeT (DUF2065 family)